MHYRLRWSHNERHRKVSLRNLPWSGYSGDKELGALRVGACVGHAEVAWACQDEGKRYHSTNKLLVKPNHILLPSKVE